MFSSLKVPDYRLYWFGMLISLSGTWLQQVALSWLVFKLTGSSLLLGLVGFFNLIPISIFALFAGVIADRVQKRRLLIVTQTLFAVTALLLGLLVHLEIITTTQIILIALLNGTILAFDAPARQAMVIEVVGKNNLLNAIALNSAAFNAARFIGPALAGILIASIGMAGCFYLNGVSFLALIFALVLMHTRSNSFKNKTRLIRSLGDGLLFIWNNKVIRTLIILMGALSIFGISYVILMPVFVSRIFKRGVESLGLLMSSMGLGALIAALGLARFSNIKFKGRVLVFTLLGFSGLLFLFGMNENFSLALFYIFFMGFSSVVCMAIVNTLLQEAVSHEFRGRVMSAFMLTFLGLVPFGNLLSGWLAHVLGAALAISLGAIVCGIVILVINLLNPEVIRLA